MRIVVIIFAVLSLLAASGMGSLIQVRASKEVKELNEVYAELETAKAESSKDEYAKMKYDMTQAAITKVFGDVTPGSISTWGYLGLLTGILAFVALVLVFTKLDNITMYVSLAGIVVVLAFYFLCPTLPESEGMFKQASLKEVSMYVLIPALTGFALAILAGKLRKPAAV